MSEGSQTNSLEVDGGGKTSRALRSQNPRNQFEGSLKGGTKMISTVHTKVKARLGGLKSRRLKTENFKSKEVAKRCINE